MEQKKLCMISQPMRGFTDEEILRVREEAIKKIEEMGYEFLSTFFTADDRRAELPDDCKNPALYYLSNSLKEMTKCDAVYFCPGWDKARGCCIEHVCASSYGIKIIEHN